MDAIAAPYQVEDGFAGKDSLQLAQYYEPLGAQYMGRIENQTFDKSEHA